MEDKNHDKPLINNSTFEAAYLQEKSAREALENQLKIMKEELEASHNQLKHISSYDPLTNLANRTQFDIDLQREIARAKRYDRKLALIYIDLDYFKKVNDNFGHHVGDLLLKDAGNRIRTLLRTEDCAARLGGDEFTLILTEIDNAHAAGIVAHRLLEKMSEPYQIDGHTIILGVSIGIAMFPDAGEEAGILHKHADIAVHCAKEAGRNCYQFFTSGMREWHATRLELEAQLHFALERNEFFLVYQPRIDLQTEKMVGMEVLLRWQHPTRGIVPPTEFIPIAEETGLIVPIGEWVLRTACQQWAEWHKQNPSFYCSLAVNASPRQFQSEKFINAVTQVLAETKIPPEKLELEITETAMMSFLGKIEDALFKLRHMGVQFSIDDFGTGYSSLTRLKELPIQSIKIDRSFVNDIDIKINDNLIIKSTIDLANDMGLNVVAEGVETEKQIQFLIKNQCPQAQGYFYSKPLSTEQMTQLIAKIATKEKL